MKLELIQWESFQKEIPVTRLSKKWEEWTMENIEWKFNIFKDGRLEYTNPMEIEDNKFLIDISEDVINTFDAGEYTAEIEILHWNKKQKQKLELTILPHEEVDFFDSEEHKSKDKEMKIYFQEPIDVAIDSFFSDKENIEKFLAPFIPTDGYTPVKGKDYFDGEDGYTPVKGKDYQDWEDWTTPVKGVDYFTKKELTAIKKEIKDIILTELPKYATEDDIIVKINDLIRRLPEYRIETSSIAPIM